MSGMFQFRKLENSEEPVIKFVISPEDALDVVQISRAQELEEELEKAFANMLAADAISVDDFATEEEAEVIIPILDDTMDDLEAEEALVITGIYVQDNVYLISAFITDRDDEGEDGEEKSDEEEWQ